MFKVQEDDVTQPSDLLRGVTRGHQATFLIADGKVIWIDPFRVGAGDPKADIVFITHAHGDHLSASDAAKVLKPSTIAVGPPDCVSQVPVADDTKRVRVAPGETHTIDGIRVEVVPAYNITRSGHPRANNWVGYIIEVGGRRLYHAGDTDRIPEMKAIRADVTLLPVGGTYTMDAEEAAAAVNEDLKPTVAVPMHYTMVGSEADAVRFSQLVTAATVQIMPPSL